MYISLHIHSRVQRSDVVILILRRVNLVYRSRGFLLILRSTINSHDRQGFRPKLKTHADNHLRALNGRQTSGTPTRSNRRTHVLQDKTFPMRGSTLVNCFRIVNGFSTIKLRRCCFVSTTRTLFTQARLPLLRNFVHVTGLDGAHQHPKYEQDVELQHGFQDNRSLSTIYTGRTTHYIQLPTVKTGQLHELKLCQLELEYDEYEFKLGEHDELTRSRVVTIREFQSIQPLALRLLRFTLGLHSFLLTSFFLLSFFLARTFLFRRHLFDLLLTLFLRRSFNTRSRAIRLINLRLIRRLRGFVR